MSRERTAEEREQARLEREAKRAAREGRPPPVAPPPTEVPPVDGDGYLPPPAEEPVLPVFEAPPLEPEPLPPEPEPPAPDPEPLPSEPPAPEPPAPEPPTPEPIAAEPELAEPEPLEPEPEAPAPDPEPPAPAPRAVPRDPVPSAASTATLAAPPRKPPPFPGARPGRPAAPGPRRSPRRWVALGAVALVAVGIAWFLIALFQPFKGEGNGTVSVRIPEGASVGAIADLLQRRGVISNPFLFEARAAVAGRRDDFKAGTFTLRRDMSLTAAMDAISKGPPPDVVRVILPEGRSRAEVARTIPAGLHGNYLALTRSSPVLDPRAYGARGATSLEGFLFPATYELKKGKPTSALVTEQLQSFRRNFRRVNLAQARRRQLTPYDVLIIASMIEREAQVAKERSVISSVIYNRLRQGIPLGIDATTRYASGNWSRPLTQSQLGIDSPYNTRTRRGLPPGPIGSPGLAAIRAAAAPAPTRYLFYVVKPGTCGEHSFSRTDAEFQRDVTRYNRERARRGGKSPTRC